MPLLKEWEPNARSLAAIWQIDEPEAFFTAATGLESAIRSDKRRIERLAGRYLLQHLRKDFPLHHISPDEHDKPRLPENQYFFSISHSYPYVAAMVSDTLECGLDVQVGHARMEVLQHKFLSRAEQALFGNDVRLITLAWCAKEAAYKWLGRRGIDFIGQLPITSFQRVGTSFSLTITTKTAEEQRPVQLSAFLEPDFAFAITTN